MYTCVLPLNFFNKLTNFFTKQKKQLYEMFSQYGRHLVSRHLSSAQRRYLTSQDNIKGKINVKVAHFYLVLTYNINIFINKGIGKSHGIKEYLPLILSTLGVMGASVFGVNYSTKKNYSTKEAVRLEKVRLQ
jgi:hypothetical protein